jgi:hypothetical protein
MNKIPIAVMAMLVITMSFAFVVHAEDNTLTDTELQVADQTFSDPGTTPDNFMYGFKRFGEGFQKFFTFDKLELAKLDLKLAKLRLAEAKAMAERNRTEFIYNLINEYNKELNDADQNTPFGQRIADLVKEANITLPRSLLVLEQIYGKAPESARHGLEMAINNSIEKKLRWEERLHANENETEDDFENRTWTGIQSRVMNELEKHKMKIAQIGEKKDDMLERAMERLSEMLDDAEARNQTARLAALEAIQAKIEERINNTLNWTGERMQKINEIQDKMREHQNERQDNIETALNTTCAATTGETMTLEEALAIAKEQCANGTLQRPVLCNNYTGTWWIDFRPEDGKKGCSPACVIDVATSTAEINWRCTGLMPSLDGAGPPGPNFECNGDHENCPNAGQCNGSCNNGQNDGEQNQLGSSNGNGNN